MARGIFTLSKVKTKKIKNEWEDPNNVWIFPDGRPNSNWPMVQ